MRLFLTATSERGKPVTKSGNNHVKVILSDDKRTNLVELNAEVRSDGSILIEVVPMMTVQEFERTPLGEAYQVKTGLRKYLKGADFGKKI